MGSRVLYPDEHYRITQVHTKRGAGKGIKMEEKHHEIEKIVNAYYEVLHTTKYEEDEYRLLFYDMVHKLKKILES